MSAAGELSISLPNEEYPLRLIDLHDLPVPHRRVFFVGVVLEGSGIVDDDGAKRRCTFPGPVELDGLAEVDFEHGAVVGGEDFTAAEFLSLDRTAVLLLHRIGCVRNVRGRPGGESDTDREPDDSPATLDFFMGGIHDGRHSRWFHEACPLPCSPPPRLVRLASHLLLVPGLAALAHAARNVGGRPSPVPRNRCLFVSATFATK